MRFRNAAVFFVLAFAITWVVWIPRAFDASWAQEIGAVWTYGPAVAAVAAAYITGRRGGVRELGHRVVSWRIGIGWYVVIVVGPFFLAVLESAVTTLILGGSWANRLPPVFSEPATASLILLLILTLTDGLGEEVGWRGFALPQMLRGNAVVASLILGLLWAAWHLPLFWTDGAALEDSAVWALFLRLPATAVIYTWIFQHTRGSVVAAALLHGTLNLFSQEPGVAGESIVPVVVAIAVHWAVAIAIIMVAGARTLDRWPIRTVTALEEPGAI
jgi:membrane protease YdiL (CAAX protease family)